MQASIPYHFKKSYKVIDKNTFTSLLVGWYKKNQRILPWRATSDQYKIWLSEIILQQTRVIQGLPYYQKFVQKYPTVYDLAKAKEQEILRLWQGLGYYSRASHLYACAKTIVDAYHGQFPASYKDLLQLKGIGPYTAAAIASIAFKVQLPVVDGNVYRVLARVFGIADDVASAHGIKTFHEFAKTLAPPKQPDLYNQAIMEFGAMHCTPRNPKCSTCIFQDRCAAFCLGKQHSLPVKNKILKIKQRYFYYFVLQLGDKFYMKQRDGHDIWQGLYDFYLIEHSQPMQQLEDGLLNLMKNYQLNIKKYPKSYQHVLTHQRLSSEFFHVKINQHFSNEASGLLKKMRLYPFTIQAIQQLPKPILIHNFLKGNYEFIY